MIGKFRRRWIAGVVFIAMLLTACTTPTVNPLVGTRWKLISLDGQKPIEGTTITLAFAERVLTGSAGCNTYGGGPDSGPYLATLGGTLAITQTAITLRECLEPEGIMEQETAYLKVLQQAETYRITDDHLELFDRAGEARLVFDREP